MQRLRPIFMAGALFGAALVLSGCESVGDAFEKFDIFNLAEKRKLQGERKAVFPEGVPGVSQGVPPDLMKGNQPPPELEPQVATAPPAAPEPAKSAAPPAGGPRKPVVRERPTRLTVQPQRQKPQQQETQDEPAQQTPQQQAPAWPSAPPSGTFQR
ncbi:MAG: hypothetical protein JO245_02310 [Pseudolabrys sp.]|nr:hypothetical protein [Pseudolabrys sp.]